MAKRRKVKKKIWILLFIIIAISFITYKGISLYKEYKYQQTYEYKLSNVGYSIDEANELESLFEPEVLDYLISVPKYNYLIPLTKEKYFIKSYYHDYLDYLDNNKSSDLNEAIIKINTLTDNEFYSLDLKTDISKEEKMLVNKYYALDMNYIPDDLINITSKYAWGTNLQMRKIAWDNYVKMFSAAKDAGIYLMINSAYRSYASQLTVYKRYEDSDGKEYAEAIAARPGYSEHQTGLALDIFSTTATSRKTFDTSEAYKWLIDNSYKYGFILRYPKGKENITGYNYESWHYRYVGEEAANYIYHNNITFDEYYAYFINNKD